MGNERFLHGFLRLAWQLAALTVIHSDAYGQITMVDKVLKIVTIAVQFHWPAVVRCTLCIRRLTNNVTV